MFFLVVLIFVLQFVLVFVRGLRLCILMCSCVASDETGFIHTLYFQRWPSLGLFLNIIIFVVIFYIWMASCTSGLTHISTILWFWVFLKALTTSFICQKSQMSKPSTFCGTKFVCACCFLAISIENKWSNPHFWLSQKDWNGRVQEFKEKKRFIAEEARRILLDISDSASCYKM